MTMCGFLTPLFGRLETFWLLGCGRCRDPERSVGSMFSYQLHASAAAVLLPLDQLLHLQPHVLQALLVVSGVLSLPGLGLGALLQLLSQTDHAVP